MSEKTIIQLAGQPAAGKTEVSKYLESTYGFITVRPSDIIREFASQKGLPLRERKDYKPAHAQLLEERGAYAIPQQIIEMPTDKLCVDGMRVPANAQRLREYGSIIVALECPAEIRFERSTERKRDIDKTSFEAFIQDEESENRSPDPFVQSTLTVIEMADYRIDSSQPPERVFEEIDYIVSTLHFNGTAE
jgi:dephospho-CoA kinase